MSICWLKHRYQVRGTQNFVDASWDANVNRTHVLYQCDRCDRVKVKTVCGTWSIDENDVNANEAMRRCKELVFEWRHVNETSEDEFNMPEVLPMWAAANQLEAAIEGRDGR